MPINIFDIYYADLSDGTRKSEQGGTRPVIIVQNDIGNKYSPTVIILPMTTRIKKTNMPTHCILNNGMNNGLKEDSMVLAEQIRVIDKSRLTKKIGHINDTRQQNDIINAYLANITGKKRYGSVWAKIVNMLCKLVKEGEYGSAA